MNRLHARKRTELLNLFIEGVGIRSAARILRLSTGSVKRFKKDMGRTCLALHEMSVRGIAPKKVQCDEAWTFVRGRDSNRNTSWQASDGNTWIWTALDHDSRLIISWLAAKRTFDSALVFFEDIKDRCLGDFMCITDGYFSYPNAINAVFYDRAITHVVSSSRENLSGAKEHTNYVERHNGSMRQRTSAMRRDGMMFAKSITGLCESVSIYVAYHNFCHIHKAIGTTPAVACGLIDRPLSLADLVDRDTCAYFESRVTPAPSRPPMDIKVAS